MGQENRMYVILHTRYTQVNGKKLGDGNIKVIDTMPVANTKEKAVEFAAKKHWDFITMEKELTNAVEGIQNLTLPEAIMFDENEIFYKQTKLHTLRDRSVIVVHTTSVHEVPIL